VTAHARSDAVLVGLCASSNHRLEIIARMTFYGFAQMPNRMSQSTDCQTARGSWDGELSAPARGVVPVGVLGREPVGCESACSDQAGGDQEREHEVDVDREQRADQRAGEHRCYGDQAPGWVTSRSADDPGVSRDTRQRQGQNRGGEVGHREPAGSRILDPHRDRQRHDQRITRSLGHRLADDRREQDSEQHPRSRGCHRRPQMPASVRTRPDGDPASDKCSEEKRTQRGERGGCRQARCSRQSKPEEHNVAGHVGDEHVAESDVADGIHHAGDHGQHDQKRGQRSVSAAGPGPPCSRQGTEGAQRSPLESTRHAACISRRSLPRPRDRGTPSSRAAGWLLPTTEVRRASLPARAIPREPENYGGAVHPTAARLRQRLLARGLDIEVRMLSDSGRTANDAALAVGCQVGQIVKSLVFVRDETPVMVLCAGDRRVDAKRLGLIPATAEQARTATGFAIGGIPPLGHDRALETLIDASLRRFDTVWCAAGTPHAVFEVGTEALIGAIGEAAVLEVG
jgi:prolyl-tRNA editing enzyme YbaK/EbsC (Cys-tRNA(Pro) deacylase)